MSLLTRANAANPGFLGFRQEDQERLPLVDSVATGGGLMGQPVTAAPTPVPPGGPAPTVPPGEAPPTQPLQPPATVPLNGSQPLIPPTTPPVAAPPVTATNWQDRVVRPPTQSVPAPPNTPSTPLLPPQTQPISYAAGAPLGTNPHVGQAGGYAGTGAAHVADFRGVFNEGNRDAITREVQANELSGNQLNDLIRGNSQYIQNARIGAAEQAAERGMLMSSVGVGAAHRAAIDAAQPFAMQQADAYGRTASENMAARNVDAQADQGQFRDMGARDIALRAQMEDASLGRQFQGSMAQGEQAWRSGESALDRSFQQGENAASRNFQSSERAASQNWQSGESAWDRAWRGDQSALDRYQQTSERLGSQDFASGETAYDRAWREYQAGLDRDFNRSMSEDEQAWRSGEAGLDRTYNAEQGALARSEQRYGSYFNLIANREQQLSSVMNSIYSNPNLTPEQQAAAAANARALLTSVTEGYNAVLSNGIPPIFNNPYPMQFSPTPSTPVPTQPQPAAPSTPSYTPPPDGGVPWRNVAEIAP